MSKPYEPSPSRTLDPSGRGVELRFECIDGSKGTLDLRLERAVPEDTTVSPVFSVRGKVLPEERVVDMT